MNRRNFFAVSAAGIAAAALPASDSFDVVDEPAVRVPGKPKRNRFGWDDFPWKLQSRTIDTCGTVFETFSGQKVFSDDRGTVHVAKAEKTVEVSKSGIFNRRMTVAYSKLES